MLSLTLHDLDLVLENRQPVPPVVIPKDSHLMRYILKTQKPEKFLQEMEYRATVVSQTNANCTLLAALKDGVTTADKLLATSQGCIRTRAKQLLRSAQTADPQGELAYILMEYQPHALGQSYFLMEQAQAMRRVLNRLKGRSTPIMLDAASVDSYAECLRRVMEYALYQCGLLLVETNLNEGLDATTQRLAELTPHEWEEKAEMYSREAQSISPLRDVLAAQLAMLSERIEVEAQNRKKHDFLQEQSRLAILANTRLTQQEAETGGA